MVRFTQPAEFNDPFELRPHIKGLADDGTVRRQHAIAFEMHSIESQVASAIDNLALSPVDKRKLNVAEIANMVASRNHEALQLVSNISNALGPTLSRQMSDIFNRELGIFCLTEEPLNLLMWAHYADHHRGVVVEFDESNSFFNRRKGPHDDLRHFRRVVYADVRPSAFLSESDAIQVFYCKSTDWAYEKEWRLIVPLTDSSKRIERVGRSQLCLFELPADAVRGVLFGCRTDPKIHYQLSTVIRTSSALKHVALSRAELDERHFVLQRHEVSPEQVDIWLRNCSEFLSHAQPN